MLGVGRVEHHQERWGSFFLEFLFGTASLCQSEAYNLTLCPNTEASSELVISFPQLLSTEATSLPVSNSAKESNRKGQISLSLLRCVFIIIPQEAAMGNDGRHTTERSTSLHPY